MTISVCGLGYVGVVSAPCLARDEDSAVGIDPDTVKVDFLSRGTGRIMTPALEDLIASAVTAGRVVAGADHTAAVAHGDVLMVCVGTPGRPRGRLNLTNLRRVVQHVACAHRPG